MKIDWINAVGLTATVLASIFFSVFVIQNEFPTFSYADSSTELIDISSKSLGLEVGRFLWTFRLIDLFAQAFVLFAAAVCCVSVLRNKEEAKK